MKFSILTILLGFLAAYAVAVAPQKAIIVSYPDDTSESVLEQAKKNIKAAGGTITHEYRLIKAFAAKVTESSLEKISTFAEEHSGSIEEDKKVSISDSS